MIQWQIVYLKEFFQWFPSNRVRIAMVASILLDFVLIHHHDFFTLLKDMGHLQSGCEFLHNSLFYPWSLLCCLIRIFYKPFFWNMISAFLPDAFFYVLGRFLTVARMSSIILWEREMLNFNRLFNRFSSLLSNVCDWFSTMFMVFESYCVLLKAINFKFFKK